MLEASTRPILVPPSRLGPNVLGRMLAARGREVLELPRLAPATPQDPRKLQAAIAEIDRFDWILFSGERSVNGFMEQWDASGADRRLPTSMKVGAIGGSAVRALGERGIGTDYAPRIHTPEEVAEGLGAIAGRRLLLVREESSGDGLPRALETAGAEVREAAGFRVAVVADAAAAQDILARQPGTLALANPAAVRFYIRALDGLSLDPRGWLPGIGIAAVGPATASVAADHGLVPDLVAGGRLADLVANLSGEQPLGRGFQRDKSNQNP